MGKFSVRIPDEVEVKAREAAKAKGVSLSAYVKDALTGDPTAREELNRETLENEIEQVRKELAKLQENVLTLTNQLMYAVDYQRFFLYRYIEKLSNEKVAGELQEAADADMLRLYGEEEQKDDELSRSNRSGGVNVL